MIKKKNHYAKQGMMAGSWIGGILAMTLFLITNNPILIGVAALVPAIGLLWGSVKDRRKAND